MRTQFCGFAAVQEKEDHLYVQLLCANNSPGTGLLAVTLFSNKTYQNFIKHPTRPQIIKNILGVRVVQFFLSALRQTHYNYNLIIQVLRFMRDTYVSGSKVSKQLGVSLSSLRAWEAQGKIDAIRTCGGHRKYNLAAFLEKAKNNNKKTGTDRYDVIYCRVSSTKQRDDLQRQVEHMRAQFPGHRVITDVGSGINFKKKGLRALLGEAQRGRVRQVVVAHRDRLCRFAFDLVEWILTQGGATLLVQNGKQDLQHEFSEDLMAIVHVFSCRFNGMRRYKRTRGKGKSRDTPAESKTVSHRSSDNTIETVDGSQSVVIQPSGVCA
jgi:predicted site-specific integrase-resolvase